MADYRKMWEDLGMDVDQHDVLCEVLPQAFGDVYLSQENRPEKMDYLSRLSWKMLKKSKRRIWNSEQKKTYAQF